MSLIFVIHRSENVKKRISKIVNKMGDSLMFFNKNIDNSIDNIVIELLNKHNPDCLILDSSLIGNKKENLLISIKSVKHLKNIPIVISIRKDVFEQFNWDDYVEMGFDDYVLEPIQELEFKIRLRSMLKLRDSLKNISLEKKFNSEILDNSFLFITVTDINFNIKKYNSFAYDFFYPRDSVVNENFLKILFSDGEYLRSLEKTFKIFIESNSTVFYPEIILIKDGEEIPYKWTVTKYYNEYDENCYLIFVGQDISETQRDEAMIESLLADSKLQNIKLEEMNEELEQKNEELVKLNSLKTEYLSIVSHDLRSPVSQIVGLTQLLLRSNKYPPNNKQRHLLEKILESAEFQLMLLSDLLDITKVETGQMRLKLESCDINSLVWKSVNSMADLTKNKGILVNVNELETFTLIQVDKLKILQVINNLLGNAVKFTSEGGTIDISLVIKNNELEITVKDTGIGIKEEDIGKIFNKFSENRKAGTMGEKGTGLGLSICKKLIELHNGEIGVISEYGKGSTFFVKIPAIEA